MKRQLLFNQLDDEYNISEHDCILFKIHSENMRFDSMAFYNSIYKSKQCSAVLRCSESVDSKGKYIFNWISDIVKYITDNCGEADGDEAFAKDIEGPTKTIKLFDLPACAGNGNFVDSDTGDDYETDIADADFAVRISGSSMEPTIPDQSIALVKKIDGDGCIDGESYIVEYNGEVMCKRYKKIVRGANFVSDNKNGSYRKINSRQIADCRIQGKIIKVLPKQI